MNSQRPFVLVESPFAGDVEGNIAYAEAAILDSIYRGEAPFASHLFYTSMLDDTDPAERSHGIEAGLATGQYASNTVVYYDRGISRGMEYGITRAEAEGRPVEYRSLFEAEK